MASVWTDLRGRRAFAWLFDNPLLVREMRRRMRGRAFTWSLTGYLAALGMVSCALMYSNYPRYSGQLSTRDLILSVGRIGQTIFWGMCFVEAVIALVVTPMITAGLATAEKEKDTFEFLQVTTLAPGTFVLGCLLTTGSFLLMVFACTLPILGLTFIFGGVSLSDILVFNALLFLASLTISAWGIFNSTSYRRSRTVMGAIAVVILLLFVIGIPFLTLTFGRFFGMGLYSLQNQGMLGYFSVVSVLMIAALSVAAARRLYDPNNRLFSYKQYLGFFFVTIGLACGAIYWIAQPLTPAFTVSDAERRDLLMVLYMLGWGLVLFAMLIFSAGRIERGDELWRLRYSVPAFRRGLDAGLTYLLLIAVWLGSSAALALALRDPMGVSGMMLGATPPLAAGLLLVFSLARLMSVVTETRNRAALGVMGVILVLWVLLPLMGYVAGQISGGTGYAPSFSVSRTAQVVTELCPLVVLDRLESGNAPLEFVPSIVLTVVLALFALLPTFTDSLRRRLAVAYDYTSRIEAPPAGV